jgi:hypothetical protein
MKDYNVTRNNKIELEAVHSTEINKKFIDPFLGVVRKASVCPYT